ncbi:MAG: M20/M25/M40 family metallo-hydrolase [Caldilinea sp.]|nr:M20/M25/M40 family metallo-hydrolase [Caldilinea sp.]MDW8441284.1 M20/M25/M40 family metallo-hydrolase [Caldilineaceae bacterium]
MNTRLLPLLILLCLLLSVFGSAGASGHASAPLLQFDADLALAHAHHLSEVIGDRPAGSEGERRAAGWLAGQFATLGYEVRIQPFLFSRSGRPLIGMNVIATRSGHPDYGVLYVGAHYDTVERIPGFPYGGPGANDNASGVAVLLELARLYASAPLTPTLTWVAFSGEEDGLVGSRFFVGNLSIQERMQAQAMLNFDCVGIGDALHRYYHRDQDRAFVEALPVASDHTGRLLWGSSDHVAFAEANIPAVLLNMHPSEGACGPHYHQPTDVFVTLERTAIERAGRTGAQTIAFLMETSSVRTFYRQYFPFVAHGGAN